MAEERKNGERIPVTVFTGFLGAGKTSIISNVLSKLPKDAADRTVILKNEFGSAETDSEILKSYKVAEMINGCLCCVLVGQIKTALLELREKFAPERIIIETSGSAFPAPLSIQIRELSPTFILDSIVTVIDCINFRGYEDRSYTAKLQAKYTGTNLCLTKDLIVMNKSEHVSERDYDLVLDRVNDLNTDTPKVKVLQHQGLSLDLVFGLQTTIFSDTKTALASFDDHHKREVDMIEVDYHTSKHDTNIGSSWSVSESIFCSWLSSLNREDVFRVKGFVRLSKENGLERLHVLNWAFGRYTLEAIDNRDGLNIRMTVMGLLNKSDCTILGRTLGIDEREIQFVSRL